MLLHPFETPVAASNFHLPFMVPPEAHYSTLPHGRARSAFTLHCAINVPFYIYCRPLATDSIQMGLLTGQMPYFLLLICCVLSPLGLHLFYLPMAMTLFIWSDIDRPTNDAFRRFDFFNSPTAGFLP